MLVKKFGIGHGIGIECGTTLVLNVDVVVDPGTILVLKFFERAHQFESMLLNQLQNKDHRGAIVPKQLLVDICLS